MRNEKLKWIRENWPSFFIFFLASVWTAGGIYFGVDIVIEGQDFSRWEEVVEVFIFLNLSVLVTYTGVKTQISILKEWKNNN